MGNDELKAHRYYRYLRLSFFLPIGIASIETTEAVAGVWAAFGTIEQSVHSNCSHEFNVREHNLENELKQAAWSPIYCLSE